MSTALKYIMLDHNRPVIFSGMIEHAAMARALKSEFPGLDITSAGFVDGLRIDAAFGKSISMNMAASPADLEMINKLGSDT